MAQHNETGSRGEDMAVSYLVAHGYDIVDRNWRMNHLELDIVASKGSRLFFVEVKTRTSTFI
ncbi:MAG: YraN family protein, partial [Muribaculaceae bacterium]|nr:YraN family protein [Muribaculaceae bacterium]